MHLTWEGTTVLAKLYFRYGSMNSGKSTALMQVAFNYEERGMRVLVLKPSVDSKGKDQLISRIGVARQVDHLIGPNDELFELISRECQASTLHCVLVDEAQFLKREQVDELMRITVELNIPVIAYGLRTDFSTKGFEGASRLLLIAHSVEEMKTICTCGRKAIFNGRWVNGDFVCKGDQVAIDNSEAIEYRALCPKCYYELRHACLKKLEEKDEG